MEAIAQEQIWIKPLRVTGSYVFAGPLGTIHMAGNGSAW